MEAKISNFSKNRELIFFCIFLFALNLNSELLSEEGRSGITSDIDSDQDGLSDDLERLVGFDIIIFVFLPGPQGNLIYMGEKGYWDFNLEHVYTNPFSSDSDGDLLPDKWEIENGFHPLNPNDGAADDDGDLLSNGLEFQLGTSQLRRDTDGDGVSDWEEIWIFDTDPLYPGEVQFPTFETTE